MNYETALAEKKFIPNIVILFKGHYWAIRQPDSGLTIDSDKLSVEQVTINETKVDPAMVNTTINTYNFKLIDKNANVTALFLATTKFFSGEQVKIWIGRNNVDMDFSDYFPLPDTFVKNVSKDKNAYVFATTEAKDRLNKQAFGEKIKLEVNILVATTEIDAGSTIDETIWPASGLFKIEDEFISYASIDSANNRFLGCIRGEKNSIPVDHDLGEDIFLVTEVIANPIDILLQCLISSGGGGTYDVLPDGAGVDESLINVERMEEIRDEFFSGQTYTLLLYNVSNILQFLETEILFPNELRIVSDSTSKISLAVLNRAVFDDQMASFNEDSIKQQPSYFVDDTDVVNVVNVEYDYSEPTDTYLKLLVLEDADSISDFGKKKPLEIKSKGIKEASNGAVIAANIAQRFLNRFAYPKPEIGFTAHLDKSMVQLGDKAELVSSQLPNVSTGELNFADTLEVLERGINWKTGDVKFKVAFTSFTGIKECYLAPSDAVTSSFGKVVTIGAGRGTLYTVGWAMKLYNDVTRDHASAQVNIIESIDGDEITFVDSWLVTPTSDHRIMFADFDDVVGTQKRYCFISDDGLDFSTNVKTYQITL